ncbi:hypothetical protein Nmel_018597, partial [Mimus melanotis]
PGLVPVQAGLGPSAGPGGLVPVLACGKSRCWPRPGQVCPGAGPGRVPSAVPVLARFVPVLALVGSPV